MYNLVKQALATITIGILLSDDTTIIGLLDEPLIPLIYEWATSAPN